MDVKKLEQAERIFNEVADLPKGERTRTLCLRCGDDDALRTLVSELLAQDSTGRDEPDGFLSRLTRDEAPLTREHQPLRIGAYEIVRLIGEGGMGSVYEARQESPRRSVALKIIRGWFATKEMVARLKREAHLLGSMHHPGIAAIYEAGVGRVETARGIVGEQPFIAMELVRGLSLLEHARQAKLGTRDKLKLVAGICDAVEHAHGRGIVHRDLKPSNILVDENGTPKILDFGVARATSADVQAATVQTDMGRVIGTIQYMSPEQVEGNPANIDRRADVYALGAILYELLAGRPPLDLQGVSVPEAARMIGHEEPTRLSTIDTSFRGDIETIAAMALAKERERRYPTAAAMGSDIRRFLQDQPIEARRTSAFYQLRKFAKRNKVLVGGVAAVILALTLGLIGTGVFAASSNRFATASQRGAYRSSIAAAQSALAVGNGALARQNLELAPPALRGWEWRYLNWMSDQREVVVNSERGTYLMDVVAAHDGSFFVSYAKEDPYVRFWDATTGELRDEIEVGPCIMTELALSPDDTRLLVHWRGGEHVVTMWDIASKTMLWRRTERLDSSSTCFHPSGDMIVGAGLSGPIHVLDARTGKTLRTIAVPGRIGTNSLTLTPDGKFVFVLCELDSSVLCFDFESGRQVWRSEPSLSLHLSYCLRTHELATSDAIIDGHTGKKRMRLYGHSAEAADLTSLSPDGQQVAVYTPLRGIEVRDTTTDEIITTFAPPGRVTSVRFVGDTGRLLVAYGSGVCIYGPAAPTTSTAFAHADVAFDADAAPKSARFIACGWGDVRAWSTESLSELWTTILTRNVCHAAAVSRDGKTVAVSTDERRVCLLDVETGQVGRHFPMTLVPRPLAWTHDNAGVIIGTAEGDVLRLDVETDERANTAASHPGGVTLVEVAPSEPVVVTAGNDRRMCVQNYATGRLIKVFADPDQQMLTGAFSRSGRLYAAGGSNGGIRVWRTDDWSEVMNASLPEGTPTCISFSAEEDRMAVGANLGGILIWKLPYADPVLALSTPHGGVFSLSFSDNDDTLSVMGAFGVSQFATRGSVRFAMDRERARRARQFLFMADASDGEALGATRILRVSTQQLERLSRPTSLPEDAVAEAHRITIARGDNPNWLNSEAWRIARDAMATPQHGRYAAGLARRALELLPSQGAFLNTLGVAEYRAADYRASVEALNQSVDQRVRQQLPPYAEDLLLLAMAHHKLGEADESRRWLDAFHERMAVGAAQSAEMPGFINEAAILFGSALKTTGTR